MLSKTRLGALLGALLTLSSLPALGAQVEGDYIEARTADVFTGPCFSNSEMLLTGHHGVMAWHVRKGSWNGVDLSGLTVAAALRGNTSFSLDEPAKARSVLIVDQRANPAQKKALQAMAQHLAGERLHNVVDVRETIMNLFVENHGGEVAEPTGMFHHSMPRAPRASFWAAGLAEIASRPLEEKDHLCGNEVVAYEPLSLGAQVQPAYTLGHWFRGKGLDAVWDDPNCRSCFVGSFSY